MTHSQGLSHKRLGLAGCCHNAPPDNTPLADAREYRFVERIIVPKRSSDSGPAGALHVSEKTRRKWAWTNGNPLSSEPVRCKSDQWYLIRADCNQEAPSDQVGVTLVTINKAGDSTPHYVRLRRPLDDRWPSEMLGWVRTLEDSHELCAVLSDGSREILQTLELHPVSVMDPKCHPLANLPRWESYRPPFEIARVVLPYSLESLVEELGDLEVEVIETPSSKNQLSKIIQHAAVIIDPDWFAQLELNAEDLDNLAKNAWVIVDLLSLRDTLRVSGRCDARVKTRSAPHEIMSARNIYADVPTRGLAMQDAAPFCTIDEDGNFSLRVLLNNGAWKKYADQVGFATLFQSETPWDDKSGDVVMAACPVGNGELIATDVPWMVAGDFGPLLAPRIASHILRMTCGAELPNSVSFWTHWDDTGVILRDIADLPRRYPSLRTMRWAPDTPEVAPLGLSLASDHPRRHLILQTGRIDHAEPHDGLPPEAMVAFMKFLEREQRDQTEWGRRFLAGWRITWQFDVARGLRQIVEYDSAQGVRPEQPTSYVSVRAASEEPSAGDRVGIEIPLDEGLLGDGSINTQEILTQKLCDVIEQLQK